MDGGPVHYARRNGASIAFQRWGHGRDQLLVIPPFAQNVELTWERPEYQHVFARFDSIADVVHYDKQGTGASDRSVQVPTLDERVDEALCVAEAAELHRPYLLGVSDGAATAVTLAASFPDRFAGVVLLSGTVRLPPLDGLRDRHPEAALAWAEAWGTDASTTLFWFAPSARADPSYVRWQPRYERQSASPVSLRDMLASSYDVRPLLPSVAVPTLVLHRRGDRILPIKHARSMAAAIGGARLVELDGDDHFPQAGDVDAWCDELERFITGTTTAHRTPWRPAAGAERRIELMGGFRVIINGSEVPLGSWGSRRARQLCKRLAVACGRPVPRDQLIEQLWPDDPDEDRLSARLSVVLSMVRRVLGGGVTADRASARLDTGYVEIDLVTLQEAIHHADDATAVALYHDELLPEDAYEDWAIRASEQLRQTVMAAALRLATVAKDHGLFAEAAERAHTVLTLDRFDERAHELLVDCLMRAGRLADATRANDRYRATMEELGVRPRDLLPAAPPPPDSSPQPRTRSRQA